MKKSGAIEYKMTKASADYLLKERKGEEKNMRPEVYLAKVINEGYGLLRNCVQVKIY